MKALYWGFIVACGMNFIAIWACLAMWIWDGDGRWGWSALLSATLCLLSALFASGFFSAVEKKKGEA